MSFLKWVYLQKHDPLKAGIDNSVKLGSVSMTYRSFTRHQLVLPE
ncbi:hypothetical protein PEC301619_29690 [Pectobacterium carotovorum subsp. carotovorum]|nr:hypothetical protein PEC301619_29690 [Pectobacterium carotovorum subsp. carotovorum]